MTEKAKQLAAQFFEDGILIGDVTKMSKRFRDTLFEAIIQVMLDKGLLSENGEGEVILTPEGISAFEQARALFDSGDRGDLLQ